METNVLERIPICTQYKLEEKIRLKIYEKVNFYKENEKKKFSDSELFDLIQKNIIDKIEEFNFIIIRDSIEIILNADSYQQNYIKYISNNHKYYSMMILLDKINNENIIEHGEDEDESINSTYNVIIFENNLNQYEEISKKYKKNVLKINLLGSIKAEESTIIKFINDDRFYVIPISYLDKKSFLYSQYTFNMNINKTNVILIEKYSFKNFYIVYDICVNKEIQFDNFYKKITDKLNIDDRINYNKYYDVLINKYMNKVRFDKLNNYKDFCFKNKFKDYYSTADEKCTEYFICDNIEEYEFIKKIYENDKTIIPFQFLTVTKQLHKLHKQYKPIIKKDIVLFTIKDFVPIYSKYCKLEKSKKNSYEICHNKKKEWLKLNVCENINSYSLKSLFIIPFLFHIYNKWKENDNFEFRMCKFNIQYVINIIINDEVKIYKNIMKIYLELIHFYCSENCCSEKSFYFTFDKLINNCNNFVKKNELCKLNTEYSVNVFDHINEFKIVDKFIKNINDKNKYKSVFTQEQTNHNRTDAILNYKCIIDLHLGFYRKQCD